MSDILQLEVYSGHKQLEDAPVFFWSPLHLHFFVNIEKKNPCFCFFFVFFLLCRLTEASSGWLHHPVGLLPLICLTQLPAFLLLICVFLLFSLCFFVSVFSPWLLCVCFFFILLNILKPQYKRRTCLTPLHFVFFFIISQGRTR